MYTEEQKQFILSKITSISWEYIPESLKLFWLEIYFEEKRSQIKNTTYS